MKAITNSLLMWRLAGIGVGMRSRLVSFLCARLGRLSRSRRALRKIIFRLIGCFGRNGQVEVSVRIAGAALTVFLRRGNQADYLVFGEMVMENYQLPAGLVRPPTAVIDGGANIGLFALLAHARFPGIDLTCYEPEAENLAQLRRNLDANKIAAHVRSKALWSKTADLFFHPGESYSGLVNTEPSPYPISCVLPTVPDGSWLKLDIEGAEYEVLPALLENGCRPLVISMEIHDFSRRGDQLLTLLREHGYQWNESFQPSEECVNICAFTRDEATTPNAVRREVPTREAAAHQHPHVTT